MNKRATQTGHLCPVCKFTVLIILLLSSQSIRSKYRTINYYRSTTVAKSANQTSSMRTMVPNITKEVQKRTSSKTIRHYLSLASNR
jgi:Na+/melibiose symporter-like transporter